MYRKNFTKAFLTAFAVVVLLLFGGVLTAAGAFSVDVDNLYYSDTSGPREISYDFSAGTVGPVDAIPANNIQLPEDAVLHKNAVDLNFLFGNVPDKGLATVTLGSGVATVTTTDGPVVLQGSSSTTPPPATTSWAYSLWLGNFAGITDPAKEYIFQIGFASPIGEVTQPLIRGVWTTSGHLVLRAMIYDEMNDEVLWSSSEIDLGALTPASTAVVLKMVSDGTKVDFYYTLNSGSETTLGTYTSGLTFYSLPALFPYLYMEESTLSFTGVLTKASDNTPYGGGIVEQAGNPSVTTTTDNTTGAFTLSGLPSGENFSVKISPASADASVYVPTYTQVINTTSAITAARNYTLFTPTDLTNWGVTTGGAIRGRVMNSNNLAAGYISDAVVSYTSSLGNTYTVKYEDAFGNLIDGATTANGKFLILGVAEGDTVTVTAANDNYVFSQPTVFETHADAVSQGLVKGVPVSGRVAVGGRIMNTASPSVGIGSATIEQVGVTNPINATVSNGDGSFYLTVPGSSPLQLKFSKPQYQTGTPLTPYFAPTYSPYMQFADNADIGDFKLLPAATVNGWITTPATQGIIRSLVKDQSGNPIIGALVTAQGNSKSYTVCYDDACTYASTQASGLYIVKDVDDGDTVTVTAQKDGYTFNERIFDIHAGAVHLGSITGTYTGVFTTPHPEEATIQARFEAMMDRLNAGDFDETDGFPTYVSSNFLDDGQNKALFLEEIQEEGPEQMTWNIQSITGSGDLAAINLTWGDGEIDTLYFKQEGGLWMFYGNQKLFDAWAGSGHQMYLTSPYPYWVSFDVEDPESSTGLTISSVNVTGPGIESGINLYHNTDSGQWQSWGVYPDDPNLNPVWVTQPTTPLVYTFTINYTGGTTSPEFQTILVESFVNVAPVQTSLSPTSGATATRPLTFSWESAGEGYRYRVELHDANGNRIWDSEDITGTSMVYDGPTLGGGQYNYTLATQDGHDNQSFIFNNAFQLPLLYTRAAVTSGTGTDNHPAWSPDGQKIAFTSNRSGVDNIWVVNADGSGLTQLTFVTGTDFSAQYPSWSPDGTKIAYIYHDPDPNPAEGAFDGYFLYTMNADGTGQTLHPLPPRATQDPLDQFWEYDTKFTQWLDSDRIAFVSFGPEGGYLKLYHYRLSTQAVTQIVPSPEEVNDMGDIYRISWNNTTGKLAYDRWPVGIQTMTDAGASYQVLDIPRATQMDTPAMPGWRPDGAQMAFVKDMYGTSSNIGIFDMTTKSAIVEGTATDDEWPAWSPDGKTIAFVSGGKIWKMTVIPPTVNVTAKVYNWAGTAPLSGATVQLWAGGTLQQSTTTDENGVFSFTGIPSGQTFYLKMSQTGLRDVYTQDINFGSTTGDVDIGTYVLPSDADLEPFGLQSGKGLIVGRIGDQQLGNGGRVSGAVVTATSSTHPAPGYPVTYRDPLGTLGGTATYGNARYYVLNVDGGEVVTVTATKGNRSPASRNFHTFDGAVSEGSVRTVAPAYDISFGGTVYNALGNTVGSALVEIDGYATKNATSDATTGAYQLDGLPRDVNMNLKITHADYMPTYTGSFSLGASMAGIPLTLFTQTDFTNMGVDSGKGLVAGRVVNEALSPLAGAVVTVASNRGQTYTVNYGTGGGTATTEDGTFWIPDVIAGDVVTISVAHSGYVFPAATYLQGYADAATTKMIIGSPPKVNVAGKVYNWAGTAPLSGATVELWMGATSQSTTTDENGVFSFTGIPSDQTFYLKMSQTGLRDVYSVDINFGSTTGDVDVGTYSLPSDADLAPFGLQSGKALIAGRITDQQLGNGGRVSGAVVTATSSTHPAPGGYPVTYRDPLGTLGGTATYGNARYYVLNVDGGEVVTVTATKGNRSPASRNFHTFDGAVNEGNVRTVAPAYDVSFAGTVSDTSGSPVDGARVEIDGYPAIGVTTGTDGGYLLANLPRDVNMNLKITGAGFVPSYTGSFSLGASMAGIPLTLFTQTDFTNMGVDSGKGLVAGRVVNEALSPLAGAVVTVASNRGQTYTVNYTSGGTATTTDGRFWIPDVLSGDVVTITVAHSGYIYPAATYLQGYADAATTKLIIGSLLTVNVTAKVNNWAGTAPLSGATVELWSGGTLQQSTTTDENGVFSFTGIPAGQTFYLKMSNTGLRDVYSGDLNFGSTTGDVDVGTYSLPSDADLEPFGLQPGKALIAGRITDQQLRFGGQVAGAVVTATSSAHPAPGYPVTYRDPLGTLGGTATYGNGRYYVLNVDGDEVVTVTATKGNRSPASRNFHTFDGAVNEGNVLTVAPAYDISFGGTVYNALGNTVAGALVEIDGYAAKNATSDATTGAYQLDGLPRDVNMNLKITGAGFVPSYTGSFSLGASMAGIPLTLFTQTDFTNMGVDSGKGLVAGRVVNEALSPLAGAVVTVASNRGQTYTVNYTSGGTATTTDGRFWIPNVLSGDVVTIAVAHSGYIYPAATYLQGYADAATTKLFIGSLRKGDINGDGSVNMADALLALQVMAGKNPSGIRDDYTVSGTDVNNNAKIGQHELIYILQYVAGLRSGAPVQPVPSATPYVSDANTVLLDHFDGATGATILAYRETGAPCGSAKPSVTPKYSYGFGPNGLTRMLILHPPDGEPAGSGTYLKYPGQLLSQANGTIEFWTYIPSYGLTLVSQGPFPGSCAGWTFGMEVNATGQLRAGAWAAFDMNSGETLMPLNTWTHVAATWGSAGAKLYINGALVGSDTNTGMPASGYGGSLLMNYGARSISTMIDELRVSNIQRTDF